LSPKSSASFLVPIEDQENRAMSTGQRHLLIVAMMLTVCPAAAQTLPWPADSPLAATPAPSPGDRAPPVSSAPAPAMSPMGAPPMASPFGAGGGAPLCMAEFARLREDVLKLGLAAKAAGQRKVNREEMCKHITAYSAAELKWVEYTEANTSCGIPAEVAQQLKRVHGNTEQIKEKICAAGRIPGLEPSPLVPSRKVPGPRLHIAVWLPGCGQVVLFPADSARSAALSPKSGG
jgi:hypothetical protein